MGDRKRPGTEGPSEAEGPRADETTEVRERLPVGGAVGPGDAEGGSPGGARKGRRGGEGAGRRRQDDDVVFPVGDGGESGAARGGEAGAGPGEEVVGERR